MKNSIMKNSIMIKMILPGLIVALFIASCKENEPKGDEFSWSPDGKKLAMVNVESRELLLVELEGNKINKIIPIDSCSGEKARIYLSGWSPDGSYLLYAKSSKMALEILVYHPHQNKTTQIDSIPIDDKNGVDGKAFASWSPKMNRVLWLSWNSLTEHLLFSALPDGKDKKLLIKLTGEKVYPFPAWSPDGEWIAYAVYTQNGNKNNGLWKMKYDGSEKRQIFPANEITAFQWQPDGSHLAVVQKIIFQRNKEQGKTEIKYHYDLCLIDSDGKKERLLSEERLQILELAWSPDGKQLAFFQVQDDSRDISIVNLTSNRKVKLNFNKVQQFFGWGNPDQVFYTADYPEDLVAPTKQQKEARELLDALRGIQHENLFILCDRFQRKKLDKNIYAFAFESQNSAAAYYKPFKTEILGSQIFYPVIEFANGTQVYPARSRAQYVSVAEELYLNQKYHDALDHLSQYWDIDLNSVDFSAKFDFDKIIEKMNTNLDSSQYQIFMDGLKDGTLLRTIMTLRKLNQIEKADWLYEQFNKSIFFIISQEKDKKDILDQAFWTIMGTYGRYNELSAGIKDLDKFLQTEKLDSTLVAYIYYAQFIMAFEDKKYESGLEKMNSAIKFLTEELAELDDIKGLISLYASNFKGGEESMFLLILHQIIQRFPTDEHVFEIYEMLGDQYLKNGQREKAFEAYQLAVTLHFAQYEIWDKILDIR
jgi:hypothetical protein